MLLDMQDLLDPIFLVNWEGLKFSRVSIPIFGMALNE